MKSLNPRLLATVGLAIVMAGCVPSLHPLYTEKDVIYDPALEGTWASKNENEKDSWTFRKSDQNSYEVVIDEDGDPRSVRGRLVQLGNYRFLDTEPADLQISNGTYKAHLIPGHLILRIGLEGDVLWIAALDHDWFKKMADEKKAGVPYERLGIDRFVLTAKTGQLQAFILRHAGDAEAFVEEQLFRRN